VFSSKFTSSEGASTQFDIVKNGDTYYAFVDGKYNGLTLDGQEVLDKVVSSYKDMCLHAGLDSALS